MNKYLDGGGVTYLWEQIKGLVTKETTARETAFNALADVATSGSYDDLEDKPNIPSQYTLPKATASTLGGVIIGDGLAVADGVVSCNCNESPTDTEISSLFDSNYGTVTITQKENETITVTCNGNSYTATFKELLGYPWAASVLADSGYVAGELSATSGKVIASVEITVGDATEAPSGNVKLTFSDGTVEYYNVTGELSQSSFYKSSAISVEISGNDVTSLGNAAFASYMDLTSITIPDSVTYIGRGAFNGCASLESLTLPQNLTVISDSMFYNCPSLKTLTLPSGITSIGIMAFMGCTSLEVLTVKAPTPPVLGSMALDSTALTEIHVPSASLSAYQAATNWSEYASIMVGY